MKYLLLPFVLFIAAAPAAAAQHWKVDFAKSKLGFMVKWSNEPFVATFKSWKADIDFDPADLAHSKAVVTIDMSSEDSGDDENDSGLKSIQGFAVSKFPTAKFETTSITHGQGNAYTAQGTLTLHGVSKAITLPFNLNIAGNTAHMVGKAVAMRPDFGLAPGEFAGETPIAHAVTITIDLTATKS